MLVTESGITTLVRLLQPENLELPMLVPPVITISLSLPVGIEFIAVVGILAYSIGQSRNAAYPMLVTESGIITLVRLLQLSNA